MRFTITIASLALLCSMKGAFAGFPTGSEEEVAAFSAEIAASIAGGPQIDDDGSFPIIVEYKNGRGRAAAMREAKGRKAKVDMPYRNVVSIQVMNLEALMRLENNEDIEFIEYDNEVHTLVHERGPTMSIEERRRLVEDVPWGITRVSLDGIPAPTTNFKPKICVVDTGYENGHSDLPTIAAHGVDGYDDFYGSNQKWFEDGDSHGTHCAGTIGAIGGNNNGVTSVNPDPDSFTFFIGKGLTNSGSGSDAGVAAAIDACGQAGADIISMSLGGGSPSNTIGQSVENWYNQNVLIIAAAGNDGNSAKGWPASHPEVMSVAATNDADGRASFSQFNDQVEIAAPGVNVLSTVPPNGYSSYSGTSMATPHVAGVAARVWAHFPECTNHQIRTVLIRTAEDKGSSGCDTRFGYGIINATAAWELLDTYGCGAGGDTPDPPASGAVGGCGQPIPPLPPLGPPPPTPAPVTPAPQPPTIATPAPVTPAPVTAAPVSAPSGNCPAGFHELELFVTTDFWPEELRFQVRRDGTRLYTLFFDWEYTYYYYGDCLPVGGDYVLRMIDTFYDGLEDPGEWNVNWNGEQVYLGPGPVGSRRIDVDVDD